MKTQRQRTAISAESAVSLCSSPCSSCCWGWQSRPWPSLCWPSAPRSWPGRRHTGLGSFYIPQCAVHLHHTACQPWPVRTCLRQKLCLVSILGFILYCITYHPDERSSLQFIVKLLYFVLCTIGLVISVLVMAFAGHHYSQTSSFSCKQVGEDCVCTLDQDDPIARTFTYEGVSDCEVITGTLALYFLLQIVLNLAQAVVCAVGLFIMWKQRYQVFFAGLQIGSPSSSQWHKV